MIFNIVTRTNGSRVGINLLEVLTITPNGANTNCDIRFQGTTVSDVIGSVDELVKQFNLIIHEYREYQTTYSRRVTR